VARAARPRAPDAARLAPAASRADGDAASQEREPAQAERLELERRLEETENAVRESEAARRELQAAHEARDAAEVEAIRHAEREAEREAVVETIVDLTSITKDDETRVAMEQRMRALERALQEAEKRAEAAELELDIHRQSTSSATVERPAESLPAAPTVGAPEQFRGPARGAKRVAFTADIALQIDGNPGKLVDLSMTGAQVLTPSAVNPNRLVTVTLPLGDGALACKAKVAWSRLEPRAGRLWYRAGVQFTSVDPQGLEGFFDLHRTEK
jgi:hypothetical protein